MEHLFFSIDPNNETHIKTARIAARIAAQHYDIGEHAVLSRSQKKTIVAARKMAIWLTDHCTDITNAQLARLFSREGPTISHAIRSIDRRRATDTSFNTLLTCLINETLDQLINLGETV